MSVTRVGVINRLCLTSRANGRSEHQDVTLIKDQLAREMCGISKVLTRPLREKKTWKEGRKEALRKDKSGRPLLKFTIPRWYVTISFVAASKPMLIPRILYADDSKTENRQNHLISCGCETHKAAHYERVKSLEIDYRQVDLPLTFNLEDSRVSTCLLG